MLKVENVSVRYGALEAVSDASFAVEAGKVVCLVGANGAGKSTTLKAISGLLKTEDGEVTRGEIVFDGQRIDGIDPDQIVRRGIFQVMEGRRIISDMTALENLRLGAFTRSDRNVADDIEMVFKYFPRLKERTGLAGYLSGGEQQMLAIARTLMGNPVLLLLDEPSEGLAPIIVQRIGELLRQLRDTGATVLIAEQNMHFCLGIASQATVIDKGQIVYSASIDDLKANEQIRQRYLAL